MAGWVKEAWKRVKADPNLARVRHLVPIIDVETIMTHAANVESERCVALVRLWADERRSEGDPEGADTINDLADALQADA